MKSIEFFFDFFNFFRLLNLIAFDSEFHRNAFCMLKNEEIPFEKFLDIFQFYGWNEGRNEEEKLSGDENTPPNENFGLVLSLLFKSMYVKIFPNFFKFLK